MPALRSLLASITTQFCFFNIHGYPSFEFSLMVIFSTLEFSSKYFPKM